MDAIKLFYVVCVGCSLRKNQQENFGNGHGWRASCSLELPHSDLMDPFPYPSIRKARYALTFIDYCTRYTWMYFLKLKSKVFEHINIFKVHEEKYYGNMINIFFIDNVGKHIKKYVQQFCYEIGFKLQHTIPFTYQ